VAAVTRFLPFPPFKDISPPTAVIVFLVTGNGLKDTVSAQKAAGEPSFAGAGMIQIPPDLNALITKMEDGFGNQQPRP
jgi:hypothetical protein